VQESTPSAFTLRWAVGFLLVGVVALRLVHVVADLFPRPHGVAVTAEVMHSAIIPPLFPILLGVSDADIQHVALTHLVAVLQLAGLSSHGFDRRRVA